MVIDGHGGPIFDDVSSPTFSADGRRIAYVASMGGKQCAVVDGVQGPRYDRVGEVLFSPDGTRVAYPAQPIASIPTGFSFWPEWQADHETVVEGTPVFSANGRHLAYEAEIHDEAFAVSDSSEARYHDLLNGTLQFLPEGSPGLRGGSRRETRGGGRQPQTEPLTTSAPAISCLTAGWPTRRRSPTTCSSMWTTNAARP
jgi:hypothetical protein